LVNNEVLEIVTALAFSKTKPWARAASFFDRALSEGVIDLVPGNSSHALKLDWLDKLSDFPRAGKEGDIDSLQKFTEAVDEFLDLAFEVIFESLIFLGELPEVGHIHFHKLDELLSHEADLRSQPNNDGIDKP
jgi:hypothetical protein